MYKRELLKFIKVKDSGDEQIAKKARDSEYVLSSIDFSDAKTEENVAERTHLIIVYNGKNTTASSIAVSNQVPKKNGSGTKKWETKSCRKARRTTRSLREGNQGSDNKVFSPHSFKAKFLFDYEK